MHSLFSKILFFILCLFLNNNLFGFFGFNKENYGKVFQQRGIVVNTGLYETVIINKPDYRVEGVFLQDSLIRITFYPQKKTTELELISVGSIYSNKWFLLSRNDTTHFYLSNSKINGQLIGMLVCFDPKDSFTSFQLYGGVEPF